MSNPIVLVLLLLSFPAFSSASLYDQVSPPGQCSAADASCATPTRTPPPVASNYLPRTARPKSILIANITAATFSDSHYNSVPTELFGRARHFRASDADLQAYVHPRVVVNPREWARIVSQYADPSYFDVSGTWSKYFQAHTRNIAINSNLLGKLASLYTSSATSVYTALPIGHPSYAGYRKSLRSLATNITLAGSHTHDSLFLCALWAAVARLRWSRHQTDFLSEDASHRCIHATVAWATILLAHRAYHCDDSCPTGGQHSDRLFIWDTSRAWGLDVDWATGGTGMSLAYDVLYDEMTPSQRRTVRSAIAVLVMKRYAWGTSSTSKPQSPNVMEFPHRAFSNWAAYNAHLYITNLAIEHEDDFDEYTISVFKREGVSKVGFNGDLNIRYTALLENFFNHSIYPDGSTFEDGYTYFTALREGSIAFVAAERRGSHILSTPRFRNTIHNAAQMMEPWHCGSLIGHGSGGGSVFNAYVGLFKYAYPQGALPSMLWRQRFGSTYENNKPCRISWTQAALQLSFLGGEHSTVTSDSPESLPEAVRDFFPTSFYSPRRGLFIARASIEEMAVYVHFDCRPDAFFPGHDNADRGVFTFSALRRTWMDDLLWSTNKNSEKHSVVHIDGLAQGLKAPSCHPLRVEDSGGVIISAGDLTYAYNYQWGTGINRTTPFRAAVHEYDINGTRTLKWVHFTEPEEQSPYDLGWPLDDDASDIGLTRATKLSSEEHVGFFGLWYWRRQYRPHMLEKIVRSVAVVKSGPHMDDMGLFIVVDSIRAGAGEHKFESYLILKYDVIVEEEASNCVSNHCLIVLMPEDGSDDRVDIHVRTLEEGVQYRFERFDLETERRAGRPGKPRVIVTSIADSAEEIWMVMHAHRGNRHDFAVRMLDPDDFEDDDEKENTEEQEHSSDAKPRADDDRAGTNGVLQITGELYHKFFTVRQEDLTIMETNPLGQGGTSNNQMGGTAKPLWELPPMRTYTLTPWETRRLFEHQLEEDSRVFYHKTGRAAQAVFRFYALSSKGNNGQVTDVLSTCFGGNNMQTDIRVYDCGDEYAEDGDAYLERGCALVQKSEGVVDGAEACMADGGYAKRRVELQLRRGRLYYAVVSMDTVDSRMRRLVLSHETGALANVATATKTPRPAAKFGGPPMGVRALAFQVTTVLRDWEFENNTKHFYAGVENAQFQRTFIVEGHGDDENEVSDVFLTCGWKTNVEVQLGVYDCGPVGEEWEESYRQRKCEKLTASGERDRCKGFRTKMRTVLEEKRSFLLVVSVLKWANNAASAVVSLHHHTITG